MKKSLILLISTLMIFGFAIMSYAENETESTSFIEEPSSGQTSCVVGHDDISIEWAQFWNVYFGSDENAYVDWNCGMCNESGKEKPTVTAEVKKKASCSEEGIIEYVATVLINGESYSDTCTESISESAHSFLATWKWNGYASATAELKCSVCGKLFLKTAKVTKKEVNKATCTKGGTIVYTATVVEAGKTFVNTKKQTTNSLGHKYNATWNWSGISSADLIYKCVNGCGYSKTVKGTITSVSKKATLKANGVKTYTAKATLNKKTYTNVKKVIIYKPDKFSLSNAVCIYTGKAQNPKVTVKDAAGKVISNKFYTVVYSDNVKVGTATAKVTFKGNYSGTKVLTYKIVKKPTVGRPGGLAASSITANSLKLSWNNVSGATGYIVYRYIASSDKYQKIGSVKSNGITINNLKASSTYKYCVQAYVVKYGQTFYSAKSPVLSVKTKAGSSVKYYKNTNVPDFGWYCGTKLYDSRYDDGMMAYSYLWDDYYYYSTNRNTISDYESYIKKFGFSYYGYDYGDHGTFYQYINYKTETVVIIMVPYDYEDFIIVGIS